jgi:DNA polymerase V
MGANKPFSIFWPGTSNSQVIPFFNTTHVAAGFPSPADDYLEERIDLNTLLIKNPISTFLVRVAGDSMRDVGIFDKSLLIVDKSITPGPSSSCLCVLNGEFTVKKVRKEGSVIYLVPHNPAFKEILVTPEMDFSVWGVVTNVIHKPL